MRVLSWLSVCQEYFVRCETDVGHVEALFVGASAVPTWHRRYSQTRVCAAPSSPHSGLRVRPDEAVWTGQWGLVVKKLVWPLKPVGPERAAQCSELHPTHPSIGGYFGSSDTPAMILNTEKSMPAVKNCIMQTIPSECEDLNSSLKQRGKNVLSVIQKINCLNKPEELGALKYKCLKDGQSEVCPTSVRHSMEKNKTKHIFCFFLCLNRKVLGIFLLRILSKIKF